MHLYKKNYNNNKLEKNYIKKYNKIKKINISLVICATPLANPIVFKHKNKC